ncbi:MMPL family transporter [Bacillus aquiflavi]|uniref:MMPL family transporter n=1 Tax=Bacillus aquiflavi TaxID=2672567 RepID=UPI001CA98312|nr:MMPL family transporter [Bacillus aquiflavi]UAC49206.1 MMPL family transporter [Bacillus aquiflavi]
MKCISTFVSRFYKWILSFWIVITIVLGYFAIQLPSLLHGDGFEMSGDFKTVEKELIETFNFPNSTLFLLFEKAEKESKSEFEEKIDTTLEEVEKLNITMGIQSPNVNQELRKNDISYAIIMFDKDQKDMKHEVQKIRKLIAHKENVNLTGAPVLNEDINKASQNDLVRAEMIGLPVALIVLLIAFGSILSSIVPIILGVITVIASFGTLTFIGEKMTLSIFILNIIPMIGLALSIDFALLFIHRYREELIMHNNKFKAIETTIQTAGRSIVFSAVCVFIGIATMMLIKIDIFQTIAIGGMIVIAISAISAITLLPSILLLLGNHLNRWMIIKPRSHNTSWWTRFAYGVMKRPILISVTALISLTIAILPVKNINLSIPEADSLPKDYESRIAIEKIQQEFQPKKESIVYVVAERKDGWADRDGLDQLKDLVKMFEKDSLVGKVESIYGLSQINSSEQLAKALSNRETSTALQPILDQFVKDDKLLLPVHLKTEATSEKAKKWVRNWSNKETDIPLLFGGEVKFNQEIYDEIGDKFALCIAIIVIATFFILMLAFRSVIIPLKAILMNTIGLLSTFGILVWLFQGGHFGLHETDIALVIPILVFSLVFGLSMDYEVFLISRIHELYQKTHDNDEATAKGLALTSKIITYAALIMIVITGAFAFTGVVPVKQIGIGIAIAILIDATIIRLLLVPSLMKLLGHWNWWMPFVRTKQQSKL